MPTQITVFENNDIPLDITLENSDGSAFDLSVADEITFYLKSSPNDADSDSVAQYTLNGGAITFQTNGQDGAIFVQVTGTDIASPATMFYHLDVVISGKRRTLMEGTCVVVNV